MNPEMTYGNWAEMTLWLQGDLPEPTYPGNPAPGDPVEIPPGDLPPPPPMPNPLPGK